MLPLFEEILLLALLLEEELLLLDAVELEDAVSEEPDELFSLLSVPQFS